MNTEKLLCSITGACALVLMLATWPQLLSLERFPVIAQFTALRGLLVLAAAAGVLALGLTAWRFPSWRRSATVLAAGLIAIAIANAWIMANRGFTTSVESSDAAELTVFVWNVYRDGPEPALIADFALTNDVDVIALLEVGPSTVNQVAGSMARAGRPMQTFTLTFHQAHAPRYTALLISKTLGQYIRDSTVGSTPRVPSVVAKPQSGSGPTLIAGHAAPPFPGLMRTWADGLEWLADRCTGDEVIILGDFNATLDHFSRLRSAGNHVGDCRDAAQALGGGSLATWPSQVPMFLGSPIDHVVASSAWEFNGYRIATELDGQGSGCEC